MTINHPGLNQLNISSKTGAIGPVGPIAKSLAASSDLIELASAVLEQEAAAILRVKDRLDHNFESALALLLACPGKVVVTGMGKSGHIGTKIAATFASTGTPAFLCTRPSSAMATLACWTSATW